MPEKDAGRAAPTAGPCGIPWIRTKPMYAETTRGLETPVRDAASTLTDEYPAALATLVRADRASHDVAQTTLREFRGKVDLYPDR